MGFVWIVIVGFLIGLVARWIIPGTQSLGFILTTVLGIAGSFVAGYAGQALGWYAQGQPASYIAAVVGAAVLLFVVGMLKGA
ncbi:GlsB/YeaQ/YmgE family stress response membrane protein [Sphaerotilus sp.]|jgi:uncharacterized membrane protein YeaQ/YmgE (transglycosylase-associated protein family)|uniref:GlsB/YeaQ/YmgE family stress response membrane protein n=1 Tax=Sphaerotilus sp. TaxID=2093942 RepID=UPI0025D62678|nr:GlsB/YeaQ/YmgE family stress response membrane protein [Sphaerotilus sp.]